MAVKGGDFMEGWTCPYPDESEKPNPKNPRVENSKNISKPAKKKLNDLDKYLIFAFANLILYTIISQVIFTITQQEMTALTTCFFAAFGGEILMCALIKRLKLHKEVKDINEQTSI